MYKIMKHVAAPMAAVMLMSAVGAVQPAAALPMASKITADVSTATDVTPVQWRHDRGRPRWYGPGPAAAILGGVLVGGVLVASAVAEHRATDAALRRCASEFRAFDARSGTYIDGRGEAQICPYLF